jgi:hypothetical protein
MRLGTHCMGTRGACFEISHASSLRAGDGLVPFLGPKATLLSHKAFGSCRLCPTDSGEVGLLSLLQLIRCYRLCPEAAVDAS